MTSPPRRIAVLNNNTDRSAFAAAFADDGHKVVAALQPLRPGWQFDVWQARDGQLPPAPQAYQGWVLTGSVASVNDGEPWMLQLADLVRQAHQRRVPLVGLCFGHQMVAHALGGTVGLSPGGWRIGTAPTQYAEALPFMQPAQARISLFAAHQEQVLQPPPGARVVGGDSFAPVGAMAIGSHIFTTQYHPELSLDFMRALLDACADEWPAAQVAQARRQVEVPVDAALFMRWVVQFLEQPPQLQAPST
jgi:GMP synthase-like glutamine amidotransferase